VDARFHREEKLGIYCKAYHVAAGQVEYEIVSTSGDTVYSAKEDLPAAARSEVAVQRFIDLHSFAPGDYSVRLKITDRIRGQQATTSSRLTVLE
jgi:hypothetical protein